MCFHIRWFDSTLDWECHRNLADSELVAQQLAQLEEGFTIEKNRTVKALCHARFSKNAEAVVFWVHQE
jgi:hypothetical protein